jgi:hypothetical protein
MYQRKTVDEFEVQQWTSPLYGWETVTCEATRLEAKARLKEYREHQPGCPARIVKKRVPRTE